MIKGMDKRKLLKSLIVKCKKKNVRYWIKRHTKLLKYIKKIENLYIIKE